MQVTLKKQADKRHWMASNNEKIGRVGCRGMQRWAEDDTLRQGNKPGGVPGDIDPADKLHPTISKRGMWDVMQADKRRWMAPNHEEISLVGCLRTQLEPAGYPQRQENKSCGVPRDAETAGEGHPTIGKQALWGAPGCRVSRRMAPNDRKTSLVGCRGT